MSGTKFDAEAVRALANILADTGLTEIEVSDGNSRVRVVRSAPPPATSPAPPAYSTVNIAAPAPAPTPAPAPDEAEHPGAINSPMVGVAYLSSEPGAAPFTTLGAQVTAGQTVLLIEAMKTFNQIKAPRAGIVSRILVASGSPVEYGQALMVID